MTVKNIKSKTPPKRLAAWYPAPCNKAVAAAIKALERGEANEGQQKNAYIWITQIASGVNQPSYRMENERETCFAEGRRYVGLQILNIIEKPLTQFEE